MVGTTEVVDQLRGQGYELSHAYLAYLLRERVLATPEKGPGGAFLWAEAEIAALRRELVRRGRGPEHGRGEGVVG